ncbi:GNAT family N-acetyltransferase [Metabacillus litoralis]|uniref:GNAT family N-acetyltransferase n=1 Tax=Metabacillus litoralis TaxID=152268 RepID=UPI001CFD6CBE|nr:GNAT family N-acetyltransferase [Metabacillus litoralis]
MMVEIQNPSIKLKGYLNKQDYLEIKKLMKSCIEKENVTLKLELDYKLGRENESEDFKINEFMYYNEELLIGYLGICQFSGEALEVNGMVHPEYRRKGVFKSLFSLVEDEWNKRKTKDMLLLNDHTSRSGYEFIKQTSAQYDNSEYEMFLRGEPKFNLDRIAEITFRKATNKDAKDIAEQNSIYFNQSIESLDLVLPEDEAKRGVDIYLAEVEQTVVGKVQVGVSDGIGGIFGLGVLPNFRRRGFGKEILLKAIDLLKEKQVNEIMLQVAVENEHALDLYKSCGFVVTSTMDYYKMSKK